VPACFPAIDGKRLAAAKRAEAALSLAESCSRPSRTVAMYLVLANCCMHVQVVSETWFKLVLGKGALYG